MKNRYWQVAMIALLTLGSCTNDKELDTEQIINNKREIGFRTFIDKGTGTRATVTNSDNILGFTVTAWWEKTASSTLANAQADEYLFNAYDITRREEGVGEWAYSPKRYWPTEGGDVQFFAYSPASSLNVTKEKGLHNYTGNKIEYTVPDPSRTEAQEDFLVAITEPESNGDVVTLNFAHALSRVRFFARTTNTNLTYVIGNVEMLGLAKRGTIALNDIAYDGTFTYNDLDPASDPLTLWTATTSGKGKIGIDMGDSPINLLGVGNDASEYHSLHGETTALMVLPQVTTPGDPTATSPAANGDFLIKVSYKAYLNNPDGTYFAGSKTEYQDIYFKVLDKVRSSDSEEKGFAFEIGRQYNFCLEFGAEAGEAITFEVNVGDWDDSQEIGL